MSKSNDCSKGRRRFCIKLTKVWISVPVCFDRGPFGQIRRNLKAFGGPKYRSQGLDDLLSNLFDDDSFLDSMLTSVIIPSFDIKLQQPVFFSSTKACLFFNSPLFLTDEVTNYQSILP